MLDSCCCGVPLKKGTIIIGILSAIGSALSCIIYIMALISLTVLWNQIDVESDALTSIYVFGIVSYSFGILFSVAHFAMAIILVRGAQEEDKSRVRLYLIYGTTIIILNLIATAMSAASSSGFAFSVVLSFVLEAYFLYVIWSFYKELVAKDINAQGVVYAPPPQPAPGYGQPPPGYAQPSPGYAQPSPGYAQPSPGYAQPSGYPHPSPGYPHPSSGYEKSSPLGPNSNAVFLKV